MPRSAQAYSTFYRWLVFFGIAVFGGVIVLYQGLVDRLLRADDSYLSAIILAMLLAASVDAGRRAYRLGAELAETQRIARQTADDMPLFAVAPEGGITFAAGRDGQSWAHHHLLLLANKTYQNGRLADQTLLLDRLENVLGRGHETGWFLAELMIRLGLLGTVIGFIFMLGSVANIASVDIHALQQLLTNMSGGMRIALYTTLTGLGAGILLSFQYRLLDAGVDRLVAEIIELSEVRAVGHLRRLATD